MKQSHLPSPQTPLSPEAIKLRNRLGDPAESWTARWRNAFGRSAAEPIASIGTEESEVWMEYHNPMLGLSEDLEPAG